MPLTPVEDTILMNDLATIFLVDPDPMMQQSIAELADALQVTAEFFDRAETLLQTPLNSRRGCVVSEFRLHGMNGIALQEALAHNHCHLPILFVSKHPETHLIVKAIKSNAVTVLDKPFSRQDLWDALTEALQLNEQVRRLDSQHELIRKRFSCLTAKEREVMKMIAAGKPNKVVANQLAVSVRTIESRRHQVFKKTGANSVAELVKLIVQAGELED